MNEAKHGERGRTTIFDVCDVKRNMSAFSLFTKLLLNSNRIVFNF